MLALNPTYATDIDDHRFDDRLEITPSPQYESQSLALERRYVDIVRAIDPEALDDEERLTREMFIYNREREIERLGFPGRLLPIDQFDGGLAMELPSYGDGSGSQPFNTPDDYERWIRRARAFPLWVDAAIAAMREGMARGVVHPRVVMAKVVPQLEDLLAADPERSVFYGPIERMPADWPAAERARLRSEFTILIERRTQSRIPEAPGLHPRRVPARLPHDRRLVGAAGWRRLVCERGAPPHDDPHDPGRDPRHRPRRSRAHPRRDGGGHARGRVQGHAGRSSSATCRRSRRSTSRTRRTSSQATAASRSR